MDEVTNKKAGMSTGVIVGIAVIVAILFGGGAYAIANSKATKEKKDLNAQITELRSQDLSTTTALASTTATANSSTTADETATWKTYTSDKYGFSFKYPSDLSESSGAQLTAAQPTEGNNTDRSFLVYLQGGRNAKDNSPLQAGIYSFYVSIYNGTTVNSLSDWLISKFKNDGELSDFSPSLASNKIGGEVAYSGQTGCCGAYDYSYSVNHGDNIFRLGTNYNFSDEGQAYLDQIVSTFQFTK